MKFTLANIAFFAAYALASESADFRAVPRDLKHSPSGGFAQPTGTRSGSHADPTGTGSPHHHHHASGTGAHHHHHPEATGTGSHHHHASGTGAHHHHLHPTAGTGFKTHTRARPTASSSSAADQAGPGVTKLPKTGQSSIADSGAFQSIALTTYPNGAVVPVVTYSTASTATLPAIVATPFPTGGHSRPHPSGTGAHRHTRPHPTGTAVRGFPMPSGTGAHSHHHPHSSGTGAAHKPTGTGMVNPPVDGFPSQ